MNKQKGITLIALVVTIIVLIILAGISINSILGQNGILTKAQESKIATRIANIQEIAELARTEYELDNDLNNPTARYIIDEVLEQGLIEKSEIIDYGDETGIGILNIDGKEVQIVGEIPDVALFYEVVNGTIRLYPTIKASSTYGDYAVKQIRGKTDEQIYQMFTEGYNYWNDRDNYGEPEYKDIYELIDYWYSQGWISESYAFPDTLASYYWYSSLVGMGIDWKCIYPEQYEGTEQNIQEYTLYCADADKTIERTTEYPYYEYLAEKPGDYEFTLTANGKSVTVKINVTETSRPSVLYTDGNGTIKGIKGKYIYEGSSCEYISTVSEIEIPEYIGDEKITAIAESAFAHVHGITKITIPDTVTSIGSAAFDNCNDLISITIPKGVTSIEDYTFASSTSLEEVILPDTVTSIGGYAFAYCSNLTRITMPDKLTSIGGSAFLNCFELSSDITIPSGVTSIGYAAFEDCHALENVIIEEGVEIIGGRAFYYCNSLTNITIPSSITNINDKAFSLCSNLSTVNYTGSEDNWSNVTIGSSNTYLTNATINYNYIGE